MSVFASKYRCLLPHWENKKLGMGDGKIIQNLGLGGGGYENSELKGGGGGGWSLVPQ